MRAVRALIARVSLPWLPRESVGATRRPRRPIVAATVASSSGVESTLPWPIADEPTARSSPISSAAGIVERAAPRGPGSWLKPKRSAVLTSCSAPSLAPSGAKTELQESAKDCRSVPPQDSPWAFWSSTPSIVAAVWTGNLAPGLTTPSSSAPASVMILNVEPGGWGAEKATPESPSTSPVVGFSTAMPPKRPASASTAARWMSGSIAARTSAPAFGSVRATTRAPARRMPPGVPDSRSSNSRSSPLSPTGAPSGTPRRASSSARSGGAGPTRPATSAASGPRSESRSGPLASGVPSRARIAPRAPSVVVRCSRSPCAQAGEHERRAPVDGRAVLVLGHRQDAPLPASRPKIFVCIRTGRS